MHICHVSAPVPTESKKADVKEHVAPVVERFLHSFSRQICSAPRLYFTTSSRFFSLTTKKKYIKNPRNPNPSFTSSSFAMVNLKTKPYQSPSATSQNPFSFIYRGWREVKDSAETDLQIIRSRANSFKNLANSFDREIGNFINLNLSPSKSSIEDLEIVKRLRPKISEFRRTYSSKWRPRSRIWIDLSAIKKAIVSEVDFERERVREFSWDWKGEEENRKEWEPIGVLKRRLKEFEQKSSSDILGSFKSNELMERVKSSLKLICKGPQESKEVPPLDVHELLAYLVKQSGPLLDQLGIRRDICDKVVEALCKGRKDQLISHTLTTRETSILENENTNDELDLRIASVLQSTGHCYEGGLWNESTKRDLGGKKRHIAIVTTASLPWMTGTAVNPLFRAAYLAKTANQNVTLLVPWLCKSDQELVYPNNLTFSSPEEQEVYIRNWLEERVGFKSDFKISFYPGKLSKERRSIIPAGDTSQFISSKEADIAILEEPEHLNWYHHGKRWTDKFNHVVGVVHTNYLEYIKRERNGALQAFLVKHINNWVTRVYCHKVLRLSAATQDLPKSTICNVHGVNPRFLKVGEKVAAQRELGHQAFSKGAYFLGKMVWAKGYRELINLLVKHKNDLDDFKLDVFGNGEDSTEVQSAAKKLELNMNFLIGRDHGDDSLHSYKVFINPSVSDVLCTATAEALAMGKFVICADHPSNEFFREFPNCLTYKTSEDFVARVKEALANEPLPLTPEQRHNLSWEAAIKRFMEHSELDRVLSNSEDGLTGSSRSDPSIRKSVSMPSLTEVVDGGLAFAHYCLTGNEILRLSTGAIPGTRDYNKQHCKDLHLLPPQVENPVYGW